MPSKPKSERCAPNSRVASPPASRRPLRPRARLQSHARHEHRRHQAADGGHRGLTRPDSTSAARSRSVWPDERASLALKPKPENCARNSRVRIASGLSPSADTPSSALSPARPVAILPAPRAGCTNTAQKTFVLLQGFCCRDIGKSTDVRLPLSWAPLAAFHFPRCSVTRRDYCSGAIGATSPALGAEWSR